MIAVQTMTTTHVHCIFDRYDFKLCLYMGVDSENKTIVFAQGFLSNEQSETFDFANQFFLEICGGHPKVSLSSRFFCIMNEWIAEPTE